MNKYEESVTCFNIAGTTTCFHQVSTSQKKTLRIWIHTLMGTDDQNTRIESHWNWGLLSNQLNYTYWGTFQKQTLERKNLFQRHLEVLWELNILSLGICLGYWKKVKNQNKIKICTVPSILCGIRFPSFRFTSTICKMYKSRSKSTLCKSVLQFVK